VNYGKWMKQQLSFMNVKGVGSNISMHNKSCGFLNTISSHPTKKKFNELSKRQQFRRKKTLQTAIKNFLNQYQAEPQNYAFVLKDFLQQKTPEQPLS